TRPAPRAVATTRRGFPFGGYSILDNPDPPSVIPAGRPREGDRSGAGLPNDRGIRSARRVGPRIGLAGLAVRRFEADRLLHHDRREPVLEAGVGVTMAKRMPGLMVDHVQ